jgi:hypothetical protein
MGVPVSPQFDDGLQLEDMEDDFEADFGSTATLPLPASPQPQTPALHVSPAIDVFRRTPLPLQAAGRSTPPDDSVANFAPLPNAPPRPSRSLNQSAHTVGTKLPAMSANDTQKVHFHDIVYEQRGPLNVKLCPVEIRPKSDKESCHIGAKVPVCLRATPPAGAQPFNVVALIALFLTYG